MTTHQVPSTQTVRAPENRRQILLVCHTVRDWTESLLVNNRHYFPGNGPDLLPFIHSRQQKLLSDSITWQWANFLLLLFF